MLKSGKLQDAFLTSSAAIAMDEKRWEAYYLAALSLGEFGGEKEAITYLNDALKWAPESKRPTLSSLKEKYSKKAKLAAGEQEDLDSLKDILRRASKEKYRKDRREQLEKFMAKSVAFIKEYPDNLDVMVLRGATAVELDMPCEGIAAANRLKAFPITKKNSPKAEKVMEQLEKKGWLSGFGKFPSCVVKAATEYSDAEAMCLVGDNLYRGAGGFDKDYVKASEWFQKAAAQGSSTAEARLGLMYLKGEGVTADYGVAAVWSRKSADKGNAVGQCILGVMYGEGKGFTKDKSKAAKWNALADRSAKHDKTLQKEIAAVRQSSLQAKGVEREGVSKLAVLNEKDLSKMIWIPAGSFKMGSPEKEGNADEHPQHLVTLDGYYIGANEITVEKYKEFCRKTKRKMPKQPTASRENHPVVNVGWDDAQAYCEWAGMRLPTEAEWEYAARGGTETRYWWGDKDSKNSNYGKSSNALIKLFADNGTMPVGSFPPNPYGLYDIAGNAAEWCADWYGEDYYRQSPPAGPPGPGSGKNRVVRGGSWNSDAAAIRPAARQQFSPDLQHLTGFRCAK